MNRNTIIVTIAIIAVVLGAIFFTTSKNTTNTTAPAVSENATSAGSEQTRTEHQSQVFTKADVATHNNEKDCYTIVGNNVYDVTSWIHQHPGGAQAILSLCGTDGTAAFRSQHGSDERAQSVLASFLIGTVSN